MTGQETPTDESTTNDLAAENQKLRERVDELEAQLSAIQERLDDGTTGQAENLDGPVADESEDPAAVRETTPTVTNVANPPSKVIGELSNSSGVGVYGENTASSGENFGVKGVTNSSDFGAAGVYGKGNDKAGGVLAEAKNNYAVTALSTNSGGVYSKSEAQGVSGIWGQNTTSSGRSGGVFGESNSSDTKAYGVWGRANASTGDPSGVRGTTSSSGTGSVGVRGIARANSGKVHGVEGQTNSPSGYGLYTPDDAQVDGTVSVGVLGLTPHLSTTQDIVDDDSGPETIQFDDTLYNDFGGGFDSSTGKFTVPKAGDYQVTINVHTDTTNSKFHLRLHVDDILIALKRDNLKSGTLSRTARGLQKGDVIEALVRPVSADLTLKKGFSVTYMDIDKIG